jgi:putative ABC transport system ATP-binding protein
VAIETSTNAMPISTPSARFGGSMEATDGHQVPLRVQAVTKRFRQGESVVEALGGVDLSIQKTDFVAMMGSSGSGKSTLLNVAAGLTAPDNGKVFVDGTDLSSMSDGQLTRFRRRRIGIVFQSFNLISALSAEENITLPLLADGHGGDLTGRVEPLLDRLDIAKRRRHRPDALSGGEQQRVAIARALVMDPALVLADEPTGSLDSASGQSLCRLLAELCQERQHTIIVVTHEPAVAAWANRIVLMKDGRILTEFENSSPGDASNLAARYQEAIALDT